MDGFSTGAGDYNSMAFTPEEVGKGLHMELVSDLLRLSSKMEHSYIDLRVCSDGYCTIVQWKDRSFDHDDCGGFEFVGADQYVMEEFTFPDGHYDYIEPHTGGSVLADWLKDNPGWSNKGLMNGWEFDAEAAERAKSEITVHKDADGIWVTADGAPLEAPKAKKGTKNV